MKKTLTSIGKAAVCVKIANSEGNYILMERREFEYEHHAEAVIFELQDI